MPDYRVLVAFRSHSRGDVLDLNAALGDVWLARGWVEKVTPKAAGEVETATAAGGPERAVKPRKPRRRKRTTKKETGNA